MPRSKNIADYFDVALADLKPGITLPFDIHLYFMRSEHLLLWRKTGDIPAESFLEKYLSRGLEKIWLYQEDRQAWLDYLKESESQRMRNHSETSDDDSKADWNLGDVGNTTTSTDANPNSARSSRSEAGAFIAAVLDAPEISEETQQDAIAAAAQALLYRSAQANDLDEQKKMHEEVQKTVEDVLDATAARTESFIAEIWKLTHVEPELEHAVHVATYAVTFAMAFGRIKPELLSDIAMAGLLHDIGVSQLSAGVASSAWKNQNEAERDSYAGHLDHTLNLLNELAPDLSERVKMLIQQHHEKFDGTGYPQKLEGFSFDDISQLVAMADVMDAVASGQWDGEIRTLRETFETLEKLEKSRSFPEHFNPEVFSAVMGWIRKNPSEESFDTVAKTIEDQTQAVFQ